MGTEAQDRVTHRDAWCSWGSWVSSLPWLTLQEAKYSMERSRPGRERLPRTATPNQDLPCLPALSFSPSRPQHLADQLLRAALEGPGETARGRGGTVIPTSSSWEIDVLTSEACWAPLPGSLPLIHWDHEGLEDLELHGDPVGRSE